MTLDAFRRPVAVVAALVALASTARGEQTTLVFTQEPVTAAAGDLPAGELLRRSSCEGARVVVRSPGGGLRVLGRDLAAACDPCVSFDGERVLFSGKRTAGDDWNIFEARADGAGLRQLTREMGDCMSPRYLARASVTPPRFEDRVRWITFSGTAAGVLDDHGREPAPSLYAMSLEPVEGRGTVVWRTTFNLGGDVAPTVLEDGRVLFSSRQRGRLALMTITWAGDNINPFYGTDAGARLNFDAAELPDRSVVFIESDQGPLADGGRLARVWLRRPMGSHELLSRDGGLYRSPHPLPGGGLLVSRRSDNGSFAIYSFDLETGRAGELVFDDPQWHDVDAQVLAARAEPIARIPMLDFASVLDIPGFEGAGQLHCMSVYDSIEDQVAGLEHGSVKWVRFITGEPQTVAAHAEVGSVQWPPPGVTTRILGEAPVESDGSFFVNIVGDTPFYMQILDRDRKPLYTMRAWTWVRSGSQRGCIGCHENKELAPINRATEALLEMKPTSIPARTHDSTAPGTED